MRRPKYPQSTSKAIQARPEFVEGRVAQGGVSGKRKPKQASDWLKLKSTQEIINELLTEKVGVLFSQQVIEVVDGSPEFGGV